MKSPEEILQQVFNNILIGDGINYPVQITLKDKTILNGVRIIENAKGYLLCLNNEQRQAQLKSQGKFDATIISKDLIKKIECPELWEDKE